MKYVCMEERLILNSVLDESGCWVWVSTRDKRSSTPYGKICVRQNGRPVNKQAHIVSYETFIGEVPDGYELDHTCVNSFCIHPNHLEPVPPIVNIARRNERRS